MKKIISILVTTVLIVPSIPNIESSQASAAEPMQMEYLDRGTVAVNSGSGVYLSWRLLGTENYDTAFDVYRENKKIATVSDSTNYTDSRQGSMYTVVPEGEPVSSGKAVTVNSNQYITIPLDVPGSGTSLDDGSIYTYSPNDVIPADVDGDGEYELILKWEPSNSFDSGKDAKHNGNVYIDCYKLGGTKLWRIDLGININAGQHFTQIAAYDFDLDGKAELAMKTAPGSIDGQGNYVSEASLSDAIRNTDNTADYRRTERGINDTSGRVLSGDEYYTVFQGNTGEALDTIYYPHPRGTITEWGDNWGNRSERYLCAVAYLDGKTPSMIAWRGYYSKTTATAYNLVNKRLVQITDFDTSDSRYSAYAGQGNHNLTVGDVDNDGCDEILCGSLCLDNDLSVLWCSGRGHGDALHLADYDPTHEGLEYFSVHEDCGGSLITGSTTGHNGEQHLGGMTLYASEDGEELFHVDSYKDQGRGMMANIGYTEGYFELWGAGTYSSYGSDSVISSSYSPDSTNQRIFWNGDTYDELFDGTGSGNGGSWAKISGKNGRIETFTNVITNNGSKNNACLIADILGDWREEVVMRGSNNDSLLVYTTTIPTANKLYTLMHDRSYRMQVACQNAGYNQPTHISYYVNEDNNQYDTRKYAAYVTTVHNGETAVRTANLPSDKTHIIPTPMPVPTPSPTPAPTPEPSPTPTIDPNAEFIVEKGVLTKYMGGNSIIVIPESYGGQRITSIAESAFSQNSNIMSVTMPDSVTKLEDGAFQNCKKLVNVKLSESLTSVADTAFTGCSSLTYITLPKSVKIIEPMAFSGCTSLTKINLDYVTEIQGWAFENCKALTEITLGKNMKFVEEGSFIDCNNLEKLVVTSSDTELRKLFKGYTNGKITIYGPSGSKAETYANTNSIPFISTTTPTPTPKPTPTATPEPTKTPVPTSDFIVEDGVLTKYNGKDTNVIVPPEVNGETVTSIGRAFANNKFIENIILPDTVTIIGDGAFRECEVLESISIPSCVTSIGESAFEFCTALKSVTLPESLTSVGAYTFIGCYELKDIIILGKLDSIGEYAFAECKSLTNVTLPDGLTSIGIGAFFRCSELESIYISASVKNFGGNVFADCFKLTIYGEEGSAVQKYAEENGISFTAYGTSSPEPTGTPTSMPTETPKPTATPEPSALPTAKPVLPPDGYEYPYRIVNCEMENDIITVTTEKYRETGEAIMIFAEYDSDDRLCSVKLENISEIEKGVFQKKFSYSNSQARVFIWEFNMIMPYSEKYSVNIQQYE